MIKITPPPINPRIRRTQVSSKDPKHEQDDNNETEDTEEIQDEVVISSETEEENTPDKKNKTPDSPLQGHIDIEA